MNLDEHTNQELFLDVGQGHRLYVHDWGSIKAKLPIIALHGGPGSCIKDGHKQLFDPNIHRVIFFDQRGCGKSLPYGSLQHNTLDNLIADIQKIVKHLSLKTFILQGGSWGSLLALAYAIKHPNNIHALVLSGIYTASKTEQDWLFKGHVRSHFPDVWEAYLGATPKKYHADPSAYHLQRILGDDEATTRNSAYAFNALEGAIMSLDDRFTPSDPSEFDATGTKIFAHYIQNDFFMPDRYILDNAQTLRMPTWIVQGRYDMDCPPITAYELHKNIAGSQLIWTIANHRGNERETHSVLRTILLQLAS